MKHEFTLHYETQSYFGLKLRIDFNGDELEAAWGDHGFEENYMHLRPREDAKAKFIEKMLQFKKWKRKYEPIGMVLDGVGWELKYVAAECKIKSEAYHEGPDDYGDFEKALIELSGGMLEPILKFDE